MDPRLTLLGAVSAVVLLSLPALGLVAGLVNPTDGPGVVGGYAGLNSYTTLGGSLTVWAFP